MGILLRLLGLKFEAELIFVGGWGFQKMFFKLSMFRMGKIIFAPLT